MCLLFYKHKIIYKRQLQLVCRFDGAVALAEQAAELGSMDATTPSLLQDRARSFHAFQCYYRNSYTWALSRDKWFECYERCFSFLNILLVQVIIICAFYLHNPFHYFWIAFVNINSQRINFDPCRLQMTRCTWSFLPRSSTRRQKCFSWLLLRVYILDFFGKPSNV